MTDDATIRDWAREHDMPIPSRGRLPRALRAAYTEAHPEAAEAEGDNVGLSPAEPVAPDEELAPSAPVAAPVAELEDTGEVRPLAPPGPRFSLRKKRAAAPAKSRRRVSLEAVTASAWGLIGQAAQTQGLIPTGRVLQLQAPVAGVILEDTLRGTAVDRMLQPLARAGEKGTEIAALLGPPVLVSVLTLRPELAPALLPALKGTLRQWVMIAGPKLKRKEARERKAMAAAGMDEDDVSAMIDGMVEAIFAGGPDAAAA